MTTKHLLAVLLVACAALAFKSPPSENIADVFSSFCTNNGFQHLTEEVKEKKIDEKQGYLIFYKNCELIQFGRFKAADGSEIFGFSNFKSGTCNQQYIDEGFFKFENDKWVSLGKNVLPEVTFLQMYGSDQTPPQGFENIGTTRIEIIDKNTIVLVLEKNWAQLDEKKQRILDQAKFTAVELKWDKLEAKFKIKKWIR